MYIVVNKETNKEYEHTDSTSAKKRLVNLCRDDIIAYMYYEREYTIIRQFNINNKCQLSS